MKLLYKTTAKATGGRDGFVKTEDERLNVNLSTPKELGGPGKAGATNPEQLFAAGYSACFESAIRHVARLQKINIPELSVEAEVGLYPIATGFALQVSLHPLFSGIDQEVCEKLVQKAHEVCPYSNAVKNNIDVKIQVN